MDLKVCGDIPPDPRGMSREDNPSSAALSRMRFRSCGSVEVGKVSSSAAKETFVFVSVSIMRPLAWIRLRSERTLSMERSRSSRLMTAFPGITLTAPGST